MVSGAIGSSHSMVERVHEGIRTRAGGAAKVNWNSFNPLNMQRGNSHGQWSCRTEQPLYEIKANLFKAVCPPRAHSRA